MCTILFVSDIHFGAFSRSKEFAIPNQPLQDDNTGAKSMIEGIKSIIQSEEVDYLLVGGDLTSKANPLEFYYCERILSGIMKESGLPEDHLIIAMGNHDLDYNVSIIHEGLDLVWLNPEDTKLISELYREIAACTSSHCIPVSRFSFDRKGPVFCSGVIDNESFTCFVLNSSLFCTQRQNPSHGKLSSVQLDWLRQVAEEYRSNGKWKIVLLHHHPKLYAYPVSSEPDFSVLEDGSELIETISECGIDLVLHGHRHHPRAETVSKDLWRKPITFICAGSLSVNSAHRNGGDIPNTLHVIRLSEKPGDLVLKNYKYYSASGWQLIGKSSKEAPIESEMRLGKYFDDNTIENAIDEVFKPNTIIKKRDLPECLQFQRDNLLNERFSKRMTATMKIISSFPEDVYIIESPQEGGDG